MEAIIHNNKLILNAKVSRETAKQLFKDYAEKFDPDADPDKQEVWQYNKILQWLRGTKGYNDADAKFIKDVWEQMMSGQ